MKAAQFAGSRPVEVSAAIEGRVRGPATGALGAVRVLVNGPHGRIERPVEGGRYRCDGLAPGRYRVELVGTRIVIARQIHVRAGQRVTVDFEVR